MCVGVGVGCTEIAYECEWEGVVYNDTSISSQGSGIEISTANRAHTSDGKWLPKGTHIL